MFDLFSEEYIANDSPFADQFPLNVTEDFEILVNRAPFKVGISRSLPKELRERLSAASISYMMQLNSVDYTLKRYVRSTATAKTEPTPVTKLSKEIEIQCQNEVSAICRALQDSIDALQANSNRQPTLGEFAGDLTLGRTEFCLSRAFGEAGKGALFESVAISRMLLEQLCWACTIGELDDFDKINAIKSTRAIGDVDRAVGMTGRLYGWMSNHAHWVYDAHIKTLLMPAEDQQKSAILLATSEFKAIAYAMLCVLTSCILKAIQHFRCHILDNQIYADCRNNLALQKEFEPAYWIDKIFGNLTCQRHT